MDLQTAANELVRWAKYNRLLGNSSERPPLNEAAARELFGSVGVLAATSILQDRGISYIGVNDAENAIYVYCQKAPRVRDQKAFEAAAKLRVPIVLRHGETCSAGAPPALPRGVPPFVRSGNFYTCGSSVHLSTFRGAGTLGCLVRDPAGTIFGLSNNHVLGDSNYAELGLPIFAPGTQDIAPGEPDPFVLGHLSGVAALVDGLPQVVQIGLNIDAALVRVRDTGAVSSLQRTAYDTPATWVQPSAGMRVEKIGRTTGLTHGIIRAVAAAPVDVNYTINAFGGRKVVFFADALFIEGLQGSLFSAPGDSGSLITTVDQSGTRHAVALLFAGNEQLSMAMPIHKVLSHFGVTLVSGLNV